MLLCCGHQRSGLSGSWLPYPGYMPFISSGTRRANGAFRPESSRRRAVSAHYRNVTEKFSNSPEVGFGRLRQLLGERNRKHPISLSGDRSLIRLYGEPSAQDETEMTHTLLGADRTTHFKILAIAMAGTIAVALVGRNAGVAGNDAAAGRAQASSTVLKAGNPALSPSLAAITLR